MAAQCVGFSLLLISCLFAVTSSAPLIPVTSLEVGDGNHVLDPVKPGTVDFYNLAPLSGDIDDRTPLVDDVNDDEAATDAPKSYVDASVFRHVSPALTADAVKPKPSLFVKKATSNINKTVKKGREMKEDVSVPSDKLEPPPVVDEKVFEVEVVNQGHTTVPEVVATEAESMTSSGANEDSELPRLSPPIWLHASLAEAMSDPLRLPMIEPYDRYDRYSHSIARESLW